MAWDMSWRHWPLWRSRRWEAALVGVLLLLVLVHARGTMGADWQRRTFYQFEFGAAVMVACGHGVRDAPRHGEVKSFLELKQQRLDCSKVSGSEPAIEPTPFQKGHLYLMKALGSAWAAWGIDWAVADRLTLVAYALTVLMAYGLMRQFLPMPWSLAGFLLFATASSQLLQLDAFRDYAKAPFTLAVLGGLACLLIKRRSWWVELAVALLMGLALGIGMGFRMDLLIFMPFAAGMLVLFYPAPLTQAWARRLLAPTLMLAVAWACAYPALSGVQKEANTAHVVLLGLSQPFDEGLGLSMRDHRISPFYNDAYQLIQTDAYAKAQGESDRLALSTPELERYGYRLLGSYAQLFPADLWLRAWAALTEGIGFNYGLRLKGLRGAVALVAVTLVLIGVARQSWRLGLALVAAIAFLFMYPVLQFSIRHFFFAAVVPITCALLVARALCLRVLGAPQQPWPRSLIEAVRWCAPLLLIGAVALAIWGALWVWQVDRQGVALRQALELPVRWMSSSGIDFSAPTSVRLSGAWLGGSESEPGPAVAHGGQNRELRGYYLVFDLDPARRDCKTDHFRARLEYAASARFYDFSRVVSYHSRESKRVFVPVAVYDDADLRINAALGWASSRLNAVHVDKLSWPCIERVGVTEPSPSFPWLIDFSAPMDHRPAHLAAARPDWMAAAEPPSLTVAGLPEDRPPPEAHMPSLPGGWAPLPVDDRIDVHDRGVVLKNEGHIRVNRSAGDPYAYLFSYPDIEVRAGETLVAAGTLHEGGLVFGLLKDGAWAYQLPVTRAGDFDLYLSPEPGVYRLVVANQLPKGGRNRFDLERLGTWTPPNVPR